jgi:hypothetical protein
VLGRRGRRAPGQFGIALAIGVVLGLDRFEILLLDVEQFLLQPDFVVDRAQFPFKIWGSVFFL